MFQALDADLTRMDDFRASNLYGEYAGYQTFGLDLGLRRYGSLSSRVRGYGEATLGVGFVDKTDVTLVAPAANFTAKANDFSDQTAPMSLGAIAASSSRWEVAWGSSAGWVFAGRAE